MSSIPWQHCDLIQKLIAKLLLALRKLESEGENLTERSKQAGLQFSSKNMA